MVLVASACTGTGGVADDAPGRLGAGAVEERVAKALRALANDGVDLVLLVACGARRGEAERDRGLPMLIDAVDECLGVGTPVVFAGVVGVPAILQPGLAAGDHDPA